MKKCNETNYGVQFSLAEAGGAFCEVDLVSGKDRKGDLWKGREGAICRLWFVEQSEERGT